MARRGAGRGVYNLGEPVKAPIIAPCNKREYQNWLRELTFQLDEMLGFGDRLADQGILSPEEQKRDKLEGIVGDLYEMLKEMRVDLLDKSK